jgi:hypothetical protein
MLKYCYIWIGNSNMENWNHLVVDHVCLFSNWPLFVRLRIMASEYLFGIFQLFFIYVSMQCFPFLYIMIIFSSGGKTSILRPSPVELFITTWFIICKFCLVVNSLLEINSLMDTVCLLIVNKTAIHMHYLHANLLLNSAVKLRHCFICWSSNCLNLLTFISNWAHMGIFLPDSITIVQRAIPKATNV